MAHFHDLTMTSITGDPVAFSQYDGKVSLIVNVASA
jgi:glutathione peroxidase-family protein